ncbi:DUF3800 domain-containing protein [Bremerella sp. JC770]|uniref:DUF3800 domain-containing protein n=1 Tax=Bremerella sp. JC770 TaxID=3232137 RepID=UPI003459C93E
MSEKSIIYCDESGNDGPHYLNRDTQFFVLAGWITPENSIVNATVALEMLRRKYSSDAPELKFKTFKKRPWLVCDTILKLGKLGLVPTYVLAEKRFCVAGKIVETFLDPYYNDRLPTKFSVDLRTKQELANTFYDRLSDDTLSSFAEAYRAPTQENLTEALTNIAHHCLESVNAEVSQLIEGSLPRLADIAAAEVAAVETWGKAMGTLNFPCLISFLMIIEELGTKKFFETARIVHDEQGPYQDAYARAFEQFRNSSDDDDRVILEGMNIPYGTLRTIQELEFQRSVDQPLVQAADLLAGSIANLSNALINGQTLREQEIRLGGLIFPPLLFPDIRLAHVVCSNQMLAKFGEVIRQTIPQDEERLLPREQEGHELHWTSTVPSGEELPLFPPCSKTPDENGKPNHSIKVDLPLFGLANSEDQLVLLLPPDKSLEATDRNERSVPLWTNSDLATEFLSEMEWDEPHVVIEFGPVRIPDLVERLRNFIQWTDIVIFNPFGENSGPCPIIQLASDLERLYKRWIRSSSSGLISTLVKNEDIDGHQIRSVLLSNGKYAAGKLPDGPTATGLSRKEAVANLLETLRTPNCDTLE